MSDRPRYVNPLWVSDGMNVWIPWDRERDCIGRTAKGTGLKCEVATAFGDAARVVNKDRGINQIFQFGSLYVPENDPHAWFGGHVPRELTGAR